MGLRILRGCEFKLYDSRTHHPMSLLGILRTQSSRSVVVRPDLAIFFSTSTSCPTKGFPHSTVIKARGKMAEQFDSVSLLVHVPEARQMKL